MRVVSDAGPLHYLILIRQVELLPRLFGRVCVPGIVRDELNRPATPGPVRAWMMAPPAWFSVESTPFEEQDSRVANLDEGERDVIALALARRADLVLMDDRAGVGMARTLGLAVTGTLGVLDRAARRGWIDLRDALTALQATNFHIRPELFDFLLARNRV